MLRLLNIPSWYTRLFPLIVTIVLSLQSMSQAKIEGNVSDSEGKPVGTVNVLLLRSADSSLIKGELTDPQGQFSFNNIRSGSYILSASFSGFQTTYKGPINVTNEAERYSFTLQLHQSGKELSTVTVLSKKPPFEQKIDRMIVNVQGSITSAGSSALDVLEKSPGVIVDRQNNNIILSGKDGVVIMINGKVNKMPASSVVQMLSGMNANNIERIELITTPPSSFDAEGNAGFINIVLKSNPDFGTNGSYTLTMGYGNGTTPAASFNISHRKNKISLFGDYSFLRNNIIQSFHFFRQVSYQSKLTENDIRSRRNSVQRNHNIRIGLDYQLNKKIVIGALVSGYDNRWTMDASNTSWYVVNELRDTTLAISNDEVNQWKHYMANANLIYTIKSNEKFSVDLDYLFYRNSNPVEYLNTYYDPGGTLVREENTRSEKITPIKVGVLKMDYARSLSKKIDMETGLKFTVSRFDNHVGVEQFTDPVWTRQEEFSGSYFLKEKIAAAFTSFNLSVSKKTTLKLGLRYEYTVSNLNSEKQNDLIDRKYGKLFPSFFATHKLNDDLATNFSYSRRITRPTFNELAPFVIFLDPNTFISGNSALQPAIADAVKCDLVIRKIILSAAYTFENDVIARFQPKVNAATNTQTLTSKNLDNRKTFTLTLALPIKITDWWNMQSNAIGMWQQMNLHYDEQPVQITQKNIRINVTQNFTISPAFSAELSGFYQSAGIFGFSVLKPFGALNVGLQKKLKNNATLRFNVSDVFNTTWYRGSVNLPEHNLVQRSELQFTPRTFRLTYNRSFGNRQMKSRNTRATGSDEERRRVE